MVELLPLQMYPFPSVVVKSNIGVIRSGDGAGLLSVLGRPTSCDNSRARANTVLSMGVDGSCFDIFSLIYFFSFLSPSLWEMARYRLKYSSKSAVKPLPTKCYTEILIAHVADSDSIY